jgi:hypothetical protein
MRKFILLIAFVQIAISIASAQSNKYYSSVASDRGTVYFIKPVELEVEDKKDDAYADWAVNYIKEKKCQSSVYMNFSIFTKNKPALSDSAYIIFNNGIKIKAENFITEKRKKGIWKLRYTCNIKLEDVKYLFNQETEMLFEVMINDTPYYFLPTPKWEKSKEFMSDFIISLCE